MKQNNFFAKGKTLKIALVIAAVALIVIALVLIGMLDSRFGKYEGDAGIKRLEQRITHNGKDYVLKDDVDTFLVLGLDKFTSDEVVSYNNDKQADFLLLFVVDNSNKTCKVLHINRDTMVKMNVLGVAGDKIGTVTKQIALSHTYGNGREVSCRNTANAVSELLMGADVDHYASITMDAVGILNDLVGGVRVEVLDDLTSVDAELIKGETITLKGEQALLYVRSRQGLEDPTNSARMIRQKQYLESLYEQSRKFAEDDDGFISRAGLELSKYIVSDCSGNKLERLLEKIAEYEFLGIMGIEGVSVKGEAFMEFHPDGDALLESVIDCFYEEEK